MDLPTAGPTGGWSAYISTPYYTIARLDDETLQTVSDMAEAATARPLHEQCTGCNLSSDGSVVTAGNGSKHFGGAVALSAKNSDHAQERVDVNLAPFKKIMKYVRDYGGDYDDDTDAVPSKGELKSSSTAPRPFERATGNNRHIAFVLPNLLRGPECEGLIHLPLAAAAAGAGEGFESVGSQYAQKDRRGDRFLFHAPLIAEELFDRVLPHLRTADYADRVPLCFGHDGVWAPHCFNPVLKVARYAPGGEFVAHRDGPWIPAEDQASLFTMVLYLNDDFGGGSTVLTGEVTPGTRCSFYRSLDGSISVVPMQGYALFFNHDMMHGGAPVRCGVKYILRAELVFRRVVVGVDTLLQRYGYMQEHAYMETRRIYEASNRACAAGDHSRFMELYQEVVQRQRDAADATFAKFVSVGSGSTRSRVVPRRQVMDADTISTGDAGAASSAATLSDAALAEVLLFVSDRDLVSVMCSCRALYVAVAVSPMWRRRCERNSASLPSIMKALARSATHEAIPWCAVYMRQKMFARRFAAACVWPLPCGVRFTGRSDLVQDKRTSVDSDRLYGVSGGKTAIRAFHPNGERCAAAAPVRPSRYHPSPPPAPAPPTTTQQRKVTLRHVVFPDLFGDLHWSFPLHMNFPHGDRFTIGYSDDPKQLEEAAVICRDSTKGYMEWSVLEAAFDAVVDSRWVAFVLIDFPTLGGEERDVWRRVATVDLHTILCAPAVCCVGPYEVAKVRRAAELKVTVDAVPDFDLLVLVETPGAGTSCEDPGLLVCRFPSGSEDPKVHPLPYPEHQDGGPSGMMMSLVDANAVTLVVYAGFSHRPSMPAWMARWADGNPSVSTRPWTWIMEGAQMISMAPEFRSRCVFRVA